MASNDTTNARGKAMTWSKIASGMYYNGLWYITKEAARCWIALDGKGRTLKAETRQQLEQMVAKA